MPVSATFTLSVDQAATVAAAQAAIDSVFATPREFLANLLRDRRSPVVTVAGTDVGVAGFDNYTVAALPYNGLSIDQTDLDALMVSIGDANDLTIVQSLDTEFGYQLLVFGARQSPSAMQSLQWVGLTADIALRQDQGIYQGADLGPTPLPIQVNVPGTGLLPADYAAAYLHIDVSINYRDGNTADTSACRNFEYTLSIREQPGVDASVFSNILLTYDPSAPPVQRGSINTMLMLANPLASPFIEYFPTPDPMTDAYDMIITQTLVGYLILA